MENKKIPATLENIKEIAKKLSETNWGLWGELPDLEIGYRANQYDCDGKIAVTITLDRPIDVDGERVSRFVYGAPRRHLMKYYHLR